MLSAMPSGGDGSTAPLPDPERAPQYRNAWERDIT